MLGQNDADDARIVVFWRVCFSARQMMLTLPRFSDDFVSVLGFFLRVYVHARAYNADDARLSMLLLFLRGYVHARANDAHDVRLAPAS